MTASTVERDVEELLLDRVRLGPPGRLRSILARLLDRLVIWYTPLVDIIPPKARLHHFLLTQKSSVISPLRR